MNHRVVRLLRLAVACGALFGAPAANALDTGDIVVVSLKGEVKYTSGGAERPVKVGSVLELPATLRTGASGAVELRQGATSVSIGPDTLLEFPALEVRGGPIDRIVQPRGNAFYSVGKRGGRKLRVETPILVGVVKGTQFNVASQADSATISLFEGLLEIRAADDSGAVDIKAGEIASRRRGDTNINVLKMDGKAPPRVPAAPAGARTGSPADPQALAAPAPASVDSTPAMGVAASVEVPVGSDVATPVSLDAGAGLASVAVAVEAPSSSVSLDVAAAPPVVSTDVAVGVEVGAGAAGAAVDTSVNSGVSLGAAAVDSNVTAGVDVGAGAASVDLGTAASVDLGNAVSVDTGANAVVNVGTDTATQVDVNTGINAGPVSTEVSAGVAVDVPAGNVDLGVSVGGVDLGVSLDLGSDDSKSDDNGNSGEGNNGNGKGNSGTGSLNSGSSNVIDVDSVLNGLLKKPGKK